VEYIFAVTRLTQLALKSNAFGVITQTNGHYAVQDHSRLSILEPIESKVKKREFIQRFIMLHL